MDLAYPKVKYATCYGMMLTRVSLFELHIVWEKVLILFHLL